MLLPPHGDSAPFPSRRKAREGLRQADPLRKPEGGPRRCGPSCLRPAVGSWRSAGWGGRRSPRRRGVAHGGGVGRVREGGWVGVGGGGGLLAASGPSQAGRNRIVRSPRLALLEPLCRRWDSGLSGSAIGSVPPRTAFPRPGQPRGFLRNRPAE